MTDTSPTLLSSETLQAAVISNNNVRWVMRDLGRELTLPEQAMVMCVCAYERTAAYNIRDWSTQLLPFGPGCKFRLWNPQGGTADSDGLNRLVFQALDLGARVVIAPRSSQHIELQLHLRACRDDDPLAEQWARCQTPEAALAAWRR